MKISIVMPSFNQARFVDAAISSVVTQDYKNWEILFVDGGSTDCTMERVEPHRSWFSHCISEPDKGQSDALRKGFDLAAGDLLTWLNTDDLMLPGTLSKIARAAEQAPNCSWFLGNVVWIDAADRILAGRRAEAYSRFLTKMGLFTACGPSAFFSPTLYRKVGGINLDLHFQMDTELWWRFLKADAKFSRVEGYTWALRLHEAAKVSGHVFQNKNSAKAQQIANAKAKESAHIAALTASYRLPASYALGGALTKLMRVTSPNYLRGRLESYQMKGRTVEQVFR